MCSVECTDIWHGFQESCNRCCRMIGLARVFAGMYVVDFARWYRSTAILEEGLIRRGCEQVKRAEARLRTRDSEQVYSITKE